MAVWQETLEIRDWIIQTVPADARDVTVGIYTYLDGEAHVYVVRGIHCPPPMSASVPQAI